jgi:HAD superfamily hydrolase (TIGR01484 family)
MTDRARLVFSDVDGTFLDDRHSYPFSRQTLRRAFAHERVVFVSGRTLAELLHLQQQVGAHVDLIGENGAFIATHEPRLAQALEAQGALRSDAAGMRVAALAAPRAVARAKVRDVLRVSGSHASVADELPPRRFAARSGYDEASARRALQREFSLLLDGLEYRVAQRLRDAGLDTVFGGRWVTVIAGSNKGRAVRAYQQAAAQVFGPMDSVAIGDEANDETMLRSAERAFVINRPERGYDPFLLTVPGVRLLERAGPDGWQEMIDLLGKEAPHA